MMYEDRENDEIIFFKRPKNTFHSHPHDWYNHQPSVHVSDLYNR